VTRPDDQPARLRSVAEELAAEAAEFVRRRRAEVFGARAAGVSAAGSGAVRSKSTPTDPVTVVDTETERLLRDRLARLRPGDPILGEEGGGPADTGDAGSGDAVTWVLDPIDGTVNFVYDLPAYAVSVGAQINGVSVAGAVADVVAGRVYSAARGLGAYVTDDQGTESLRCSAVEDLSMALLGTGFGYSRRRRARQAALLAKMLPVVRDVRRVGSAALDLCMVAAGRLDAYYEHGLQVWDRAAGALIAAEAGARVLLPEPTTGSAGLVLAAAPGIADELLAALQRFGGFNGLLPLQD
jgi:myo-inositol-1(or 4)-monophosphatase